MTHPLPDQIRVRDAYRAAAVKLFGISEHEASVYICTAADDRGEWAPDALAILRMEPDCRTDGDTGRLAEIVSYYADDGMENCVRLDQEANSGAFIEYINAAVAAIHEA